MFLWTVVGGGGSCILSCILCYPVHIQFGVVLRRPWSDNAKQHNERSLLILLGDGLRLTVKKEWVDWLVRVRCCCWFSTKAHTQEATRGRQDEDYLLTGGVVDVVLVDRPPT